MPVLAIAEVFGISGRRSELLALLARTQRHARELPGARQYAFAAVVDAPDHFLLVSEWDSHEAMRAYHGSEAFARYQSDLDGLLARPSEMTIYSVSDVVKPVPSGPLDPRQAD